MNHTIQFSTAAVIAGLAVQFSLEEGNGLILFPSIAWIVFVWYIEQAYKEN